MIDQNFSGLERMPGRFLWTGEWYEFGAERVDTLFMEHIYGGLYWAATGKGVRED